MQFPPSPRASCSSARHTGPVLNILCTLSRSAAQRLGVSQEIWRLASRKHSLLPTSCQCWKYGSLPRLLLSVAMPDTFNHFHHPQHPLLCPVEFPQNPFHPRSSLLSQKSVPHHGLRSLRNTLRQPSVALPSPILCHGQLHPAARAPDTAWSTS